MKADHVLWPLRDRSNRVDVECRGIGAENCAWLGDLVKFGKDLLFQVHILEHRLDDEIGG